MIKLKFEDWDAPDVYCPACGRPVVTKEEESPDYCEHVDFLYVPGGDLEYVRPDLEPFINERRESAREFNFLRTVRTHIQDPTAFALKISWPTVYGTDFVVGFHLGSPDSDDEPSDEVAIEEAE